jgi:hypothetical protein
MREAGSKAAVEIVQERADQCACGIVSIACGLGPGAHHQEVFAIADALGQPAEDGARRGRMPDVQGGPELQHRHRGALLGAGLVITGVRAGLVQLGQPVHPGAEVNDGGAVDGMQGGPERGARRSPFRRPGLGR